MTEPTAPTDPGTPPEGAPVTDPGQDMAALPAWAREAITKANREAATYRTKVRDLEPIAEQYRRLEEASKSDLQRALDAASTAQKQAESASAEALRYRVAASHKLDADDFDLLGSGTEDELVARATRIAAYKSAAVAPAPPAPPTAPPSGRPVEALRPGATPSNAETADDVLYKSLFG